MPMVQQIEFPPHPDVDWATLSSGKGQKTVVIVCPVCGLRRPEKASMVAYRIRKGVFRGHCFRDRLVNNARADRLVRPDHPTVNWDETSLVTVRRQRVTHVAVTCPDCKEKRWQRPGAVAAKVRSGNYNGRCKRCVSVITLRPEAHLGKGRVIDNCQGYIKLSPGGIPPEDLNLFNACRGKNSYLFEHRYVMAKHLGRPLRQNELVDHMDGDKLNNAISNLRIYIKGNNDPGSHNAFGTYYHEWQAALAEIERLKKLIPE